MFQSEIRDQIDQVIAGTAGVPPAMSAKRENESGLLPKFARLRRVAGGTPAVPANHLIGRFSN